MKAQHNNICVIGSDCTGCKSCMLCCPTQAISMKSNEEGFWYPSVDTAKCTNCGLCLKRCPSGEGNIQFHNILSPLCAITNHRKLYRHTASGGTFTTISNIILEKRKNALIVGAAYVDGRVQHIAVSRREDLGLLASSKYVQSDVHDIYKRVATALEERRFVLFSGTPCQIAGLYSFLGNKKDSPDLFTIDLICHGVPSPKFFQKAVNHYNNGSHPRNVTFRWKNALRSRSAYFLVFTRKYACSIVSSNADPFFALFMKGAIFRMSCYTCRYAQDKRVSDITIGDCDSASNYPSFYPKFSKNTVLINTERGMKLWKTVMDNFSSIPLDFQKEAKANQQLSHPYNMPELRKTIYQEADLLTYDELTTKYGRHDSALKSLAFKVIDILSF